MVGGRDPSTVHPGENAPVPEEIENENARFAGDDRDLRQSRSNGGLDDDPTESGAPVLNRNPAKNLTGGR